MTLAANVIPLQIITELVHALLWALLQGCQRMLGDSSGRGGGCVYKVVLPRCPRCD